MKTAMMTMGLAVVLGLAISAVGTVTPVDISRQANMGFRDEVEGDRKGGWTDQGPVNDLAMMPTGTRQFGNVTFKVIDPGTNGGKSCLVLSGPEREYFPRRIDIPMQGQRHRFVYMLHACAWTPKRPAPIGSLDVTYETSERQTIEVSALRDVGDWWKPFSVANGAVVWTTDNKSYIVGLYLSKFSIQEKPLKRLSLTSTNQAVWMVVGISTGYEDIPLASTKDVPFIISQNADWQPIENKKSVVPGSVLDFSFLSDAPAGKHGFLVTRNGRLEFENLPGRRVKWFGANLSYELGFPAKKDAERLARVLQQMGYNVVRFEHYDPKLLVDLKSTSKLDPDRIDRLDHLVACLKKYGIYVVIDLHASRPFAAEDCPEFGRPFEKEIGGLVHVYPSAMRAWENFTRTLLTHRNPYTGLTWAEDPVLAGICPINEDWIWTYGAMGGIFEKPFQAWLKARGKSAVTPEERPAMWAQFQTETQIRTNEQFGKFIKGLGCRALLTGVNHYDAVVQTLIRQPLDYVDTHSYWNHPDFFEGSPWRIPWIQTNKSSALARNACNPRIYMPARFVGKPFTLTEFNYCYPNIYRSEGGPLMGAYAGFQDWDGVLRFEFGGDADDHTVDKYAYVFGVVHDPINLLAEKMIAMLFARGDVSPARGFVPFVVSADTVYQTYMQGQFSFPDSYRCLGLCTGIGSMVIKKPEDATKRSGVVVGPAVLQGRFAGKRFYVGDEERLLGELAKDGVIDPKNCDPAAGRFVSDTGQIELQSQKGLFKVVTPRSEGFVLADKGTLAGDRVVVENDGGACTVFVTAVDHQPIGQSRRLLVLHLTDVQNDQIKFNNAGMAVLEHIGRLPHLVRRGRADIRLRLDRPEGVRVWAVDLSGERRTEMQTRQEGDTVSFSAETIQKAGTFLVYEVAWK